jgi:hypothetical protein
LTLSYNIIGDPEINGDRATVTFMQSIGYTIKGQSEKLKPAKILMKLKKGGPGELAHRLDQMN